MIPCSVERSPLKIDDPKRPEFSSQTSYANFVKNVSRQRRYVWGSEVRAFLDTLLATVRDRDTALIEGCTYYRAQHGVISEVYDDVFEILGHNSDRMTPRSDRAREGRANPAGIPVLYLATTEQTAISEIRPWIGSEVSVAQFRLSRNLKALDLSVGHRKLWMVRIKSAPNLSVKEIDPDVKEKDVWNDVDQAFSRPISDSDDRADYVPTQILAEFFCDHGFNALMYRSQFGEGFNIALFDINDAEYISAAPYQVTDLEVKYRRMGSP